MYLFKLLSLICFVCLSAYGNIFDYVDENDVTSEEVEPSVFDALRQRPEDNSNTKKIEISNI